MCTDGIHLNTDSWHQEGGHLHRNIFKSQGNSKAVPVSALMAHPLPHRNQKAMAEMLRQSHLTAPQPIPDTSLETQSIADSDFHYSQPCDSFRQGTGSLPEHSDHSSDNTLVQHIKTRNGHRKEDTQLLLHHKDFRFYQARMRKLSPWPHLEAPPCC